MSELDKTIEELEKEVVAELDEANGKQPNSTGGKADPCLLYTSPSPRDY